MMHALLAWTPFLDPIPLDRYWLWLLPPLVAVIAVVWKALKVRDMRHLPRQATVLWAQILAFMALAAVALWLFTEVV